MANRNSASTTSLRCYRYRNVKVSSRQKAFTEITNKKQDIADFRGLQRRRHSNTPKHPPHKPAGLNPDQFESFDDPNMWTNRIKELQDEAIAIVASEPSRQTDNAIKAAKALNATIFWVTEQVSREHRQQFYEIGGDELLSGTLSENELPAKISQYQRRFNEIQAVTAQLHEASNMALVAMDNSSDMGSILGFIKDSINEREYHALAQSIFKWLRS